MGRRAATNIPKIPFQVFFSRFSQCQTIPTFRQKAAKTALNLRLRSAEMGERVTRSPGRLGHT